MGFYSVGGRGAATAAGADQVFANLWNPHASKRLWVVEISYVRTEAGANNQPTLKRTTTRGTPGVTVTAGVENAWDRDLAPVTGALLDMSFSVQPTVHAGPRWKRREQFDAIGLGFSWTYDLPGVCVTPGSGLCLLNGSSVIFRAGDVTFTWWEGA